MNRSLSCFMILAMSVLSCKDTSENSGVAGTFPTRTSDTTCAVVENIDPVMCEKKRTEALADCSKNTMKYYVTGFLPEKGFVQKLKQLNVQVIATSCIAMNNGDGCYNATVDSIIQSKTGTAISMIAHKK